MPKIVITLKYFKTNAQANLSFAFTIPAQQLAANTHNCSKTMKFKRKQLPVSL